MTVYQLRDRVKEVVLCDATGCDERRESEWHDAYLFDGSFKESLVAEGWTSWASRSKRHYCPEHGPRPGHHMYLVWGNVR